MPRGGNHGGGRPRMPPDEIKATASYSLVPFVINTVSLVAKSRGISKSELVESILIDYFG
jgi:hypothetical protein